MLSTPSALAWPSMRSRLIMRHLLVIHVAISPPFMSEVEEAGLIVALANRSMDLLMISILVVAYLDARGTLAPRWGLLRPFP